MFSGVVCDRGLTLGDLIGILRTFFSRLGLKDLKFKPAFNPYTEPSMEIFAWSEDLGKSIEVGNSGMFRPEMLRPMGLPEDVNVIAWGLGLERWDAYQLHSTGCEVAISQQILGSGSPADMQIPSFGQESSGALDNLWPCQYQVLKLLSRGILFANLL